MPGELKLMFGTFCKRILPFAMIGACCMVQSAAALSFGMVADFSGETKSIAQGLELGLNAALKGHDEIQLTTENHGYRPDRAIDAVKKLIGSDLSGMVANTDTTSIEATLPTLINSGVPLIGFISGTDRLREPKASNAINFRASFRQEADSLVGQAVRNGLAPGEICAYIQNDEYGVAGLRAIRDAVAAQAGGESVAAAYDKVLAVKGEGERNNLGPVGAYKRNTLVSRDGYGSLKEWESSNGTRCKMVIAVGIHSSVSKFVGYSRYKGEDWVVGAFSTTGMETLAASFKSFKIDEQVARRIVMAQVVPVLEHDKPIVQEAMALLGDEYGSYPLEGYIIGKMLLKLLETTGPSASPSSLLAAAQGASFDLGGVAVDFTGDNQGSDYVALVTLSGGGWQPMNAGLWAEWTK